MFTVQSSESHHGECWHTNSIQWQRLYWSTRTHIHTITITITSTYTRTDQEKRNEKSMFMIDFSLCFIVIYFIRSQYQNNEKPLDLYDYHAVFDGIKVNISTRMTMVSFKFGLQVFLKQKQNFSLKMNEYENNVFFCERWFVITIEFVCVV